MTESHPEGSLNKRDLKTHSHCVTLPTRTRLLTVPVPLGTIFFQTTASDMVGELLTSVQASAACARGRATFFNGQSHREAGDNLTCVPSSPWCLFMYVAVAIKVRHMSQHACVGQRRLARVNSLFPLCGTRKSN